MQSETNALITTQYGYVFVLLELLDGWGTGIRGLMRGMTTHPKVTRSY